MNRPFIIPLALAALALSGFLVWRLGPFGELQAEPPPPANPPAKMDAPAPSGPFDARLLQIACEYEAYGCFETRPRFALASCAAPPSPTIRFRFSGSRDSSTHGRKLYFLFVKQLPKGSDSYTVSGQANPVGQAIVKEAWVPERVNLQTVLKEGAPARREHQLVSDLEGRLYRGKEQSALFIMFKMDPQTPGTDAGWVYGTVTADGKRVTSAGKVKSCMECHQKAPHDRLFGLPTN